MSTEIDRQPEPTTASGASDASGGPPTATRPDASANAPALPTIIVDDSLAMPEVSAAEAAKTAFDPTTADDFAAAFRPSWEPSLPAQTAPRSPLPPSVSKPPLGATVMPSVEPPDDAVGPAVAARRKRAMILIGASVVGFLALAYLGVSSSSGGPSEATHREQAGASQPPAMAPGEVTAAPAAATPLATSLPPPSAAEPAAPAPALPAPVVARLYVTTDPSDAQLALDGNPVNNPLDVELALGGNHTLHARADGYGTAERSVHLANETRVALTLEPTAPAPAPAPVPKANRPRAAAKSKPARATRPAAHKPKSQTPRPRGAGFVADSPY